MLCGYRWRGESFHEDAVTSRARPLSKEPPEYVGVCLRNLGRMPASITMIAVVIFEEGVVLGFTPGKVLEMARRTSPPLPYQLEPGHEESWYSPLDLVRRWFEEESDPPEYVEVGCHVYLGTGKRISPKGTVLVPLAPHAGEDAG